MQNSLAVLEGTRLQPRAGAINRDLSVNEPALRPFELNLSGSPLLLGLTAALGSMSLFVWALVRLWLFGR